MGTDEERLRVPEWYDRLTRVDRRLTRVEYTLCAFFGISIIDAAARLLERLVG